MNDSKNNAKPLPPDDFSATTPNIKMPNKDLPNYQNDSTNDWEKTNYNYSTKDLPDDTWKKPAYNVPPAQTPPQDFNKTYLPNQPSNNPQSKGDEWGMTQANINLPQNNQPNPYDQQPSDQDNYGSKQSEYGATTPFINLPENQRAKYQIPSSSSSSPVSASTATYDSVPSIKIEEEKKEESKKGVPGWLLATGGMVLMFFFAIAVLLGVYYLFLGKKGYDVALKLVPKNSDIFINGSQWGVTSADDSIRLQGLRAGESKLIEIKNPNATCKNIENITGKDGDPLQVITVQCTVSKTGPTTPTDDPNKGTIPDACKNFKNGDFATAAKCANDALDKLGETFTAQQLLDAMNIYIVNFASNDDKIKQSDLAFLQKASGYIKRLEKLEPGTKIEVGGHTDNVGTDAKNQPLSERRAKSVYDSLLGFGVNKDMLTTTGYGSKKPKPNNENRNPDEKFQNRRIEYRKV